MIRHAVFAALLSIGVLPVSVSSTAWAAETGQAAQPGGAAAQPGQPSQSGQPGQSGEPAQAPADSGDAAPQPEPEVVTQPEVVSEPTTAASAASFADGITVEEMAELVRDAGYRAEVKYDDQNLPYVSSRASGLNYWINLYGCEGEPQRCWDVEFQTSLKTTPEQRSKATQWAVDKVFGRSYAIEDSTYFALPVRVGGGVAPQNLISTIELWDTLLGDFTDYIDW
jgi:hypothetical protein